MAAAFPVLRLKKDLSRSLRAGHPWVYADALVLRPAPASGAVVDVCDAQGQFVARGRYDAGSALAVRVWTTSPADRLDVASLRRRVAGAVALRARLPLGDTTAYRLIHGEGDALPGIVADRYGDTVVLKLDGESARPAVPDLVAALVESLARSGLARIYQRLDERRSGGGRSGPNGAPLWGDEPATETIVREHGRLFPVDVRQGQKTGFFLDQRDNRRLVGGYTAGLSVLNLYSYTGGFTVAAARGGARATVSVDQAAPALVAARRALELNGFDPQRHELVCADAFTYLREANAANQEWDLVIVDPPSFAPNERSLERALNAYRELNQLAAAVVAPCGLLASASCSSHVGEERFVAVVRDALAAAGRRARVLELRGLPPDHPTPPAWNEGRYLKFVLLQLD